MASPSVSMTRHTAHRAKLVKITAGAYLINTPFIFDATGGVTTNGIHLSADGKTLTVPPPGTYRISIYSTASPGVAGKTFSIKNTTPATTLFANVPFGNYFEESFVLPAGATVQLWFDSATTITAADQTMWFEISM